MRIFVSGGTGRVGRRLVSALTKNGFGVVVATRNPKKAGFKSRKIVVVPADFKAGNLKNCNAVIHLAALIDYLAPEKKVFEANVELTCELASAAKKAGVKKFVFMSSTSIYHDPTHLPIDEGQEPTPVNAYGRSKEAAEEIIRESGLRYSIVRAPMIYGPGFREGFCKIFKLLRKGKLPVIGDGRNCVPFIHVDDLVSALLIALEKDAEFIVDSGEQLTQNEVLALACKELGVEPPKKRVPKWLAYAVARASTTYAKLFNKKPLLLVEEVNTLAQNRVFNISKAHSLGYKPGKKLANEIGKLVKECENA